MCASYDGRSYCVPVMMGGILCASYDGRSCVPVMLGGVIVRQL